MKINDKRGRKLMNLFAASTPRRQWNLASMCTTQSGILLPTRWYLLPYHTIPGDTSLPYHTIPGDTSLPYHTITGDTSYHTIPYQVIHLTIPYHTRWYLLPYHTIPYQVGPFPILWASLLILFVCSTFQLCHPAVEEEAGGQEGFAAA